LAHGHLDGVEHVGERDLPAVGHVGVPALSGVAEPDRLAVSGHVGQHHHFGKARLVKLIGDVDFELAEHAAEARELFGLEPLPREAQHAVLAERPKHLLEVAVRDRLRQVHPLDPGAQCLAAGMDFHALARVLRHARLYGSTGTMQAGSSSRHRATMAARLRRIPARWFMPARSVTVSSRRYGRAVFDAAPLTNDAPGRTP